MGKDDWFNNLLETALQISTIMFCSEVHHLMTMLSDERDIFCLTMLHTPAYSSCLISWHDLPDFYAVCYITIIVDITLTFDIYVNVFFCHCHGLNCPRYVSHHLMNVIICKYLIQTSPFLLGTSWNYYFGKQINVCKVKTMIQWHILRELLSIIAERDNEVRTCFFPRCW